MKAEIKRQKAKAKSPKRKAEMVKAEIAGFQFSVSSISAFNFQLFFRQLFPSQAGFELAVFLHFRFQLLSFVRFPLSTFSFSSVAAHCREASRARSEAEFVSKLGGGAQEADEPERSGDRHPIGCPKGEERIKARCGWNSCVRNAGLTLK